ncbi:MAG: methylhydantoinase [Thermoproteota archaeon]|nr:methylhydantoinase [Thermoproteota archaeon]
MGNEKNCRRIRIGIDVGGTFTKAVAIDMIDGRIIDKVTVPTTHLSNQGVSTGILQALTILMEKHSIHNSEIEIISHSTTQAVNALLEGDTAKVGIIGMGVGLDRSNVIKRTDIKSPQLESKSYLKTCYRFLDTSHYLEPDKIRSTISQLKQEGAQALVVSEAYGVDDPSNEKFVVDNSDIPAIAGHELTGIYGLEIRTLTAAINASILPKAISTAEFVESAVREKKGINAPLMVMKGDGGVTDMKTFQIKPIVTVLSGPAASVAGALLHLRILNGVFIEVGGTSTNICMIKDGKPQIQYVTIMQHPTCMRSLDVRVAGVAGGSLVRLSSNSKKIVDVGPRSAHIAGLQYSCFAEPEELEGGELVTFQPKDGDPADYAAIRGKDGKLFAITNTCAANSLGLIEKGDYAEGNQTSARAAISILSEKLGTNLEGISKSILDISANKILDIIIPMLKQYKLKPGQSNITIVGAGGGASVLSPYVAKYLKFSYKLAANAEVISSIGVAAAMIYEEQERTIINPNPDDVSLLIEDVKQAALSKGALPESVIVQSKYISERSILRVTAVGNMSLDIGTSNAKEISREEANVLACELFGISDRERNYTTKRIFDMNNYHVFACEMETKKLFLKSKKQSLLILDKYGRIKLSVDNAAIFSGRKEEVAEKIESVLFKSNDKNHDLSPQVHILDDTRLVDFSSLTAPEHVSKAVHDALATTTAKEVAAIIKLK